MDISLKDSEHLDPIECESPVSLYPCFLLWAKKEMLNSAKFTCQRQFPSPTHSDIKMVTFSPTLQSPPSQVCDGFFLLLFLVYCVASRQCFYVFPRKPFCLLSIFQHYLPFALCFSMSIFLSFLFHLLPTYPSPILSLWISAWLCWRSSSTPPPPPFLINQGVRTAALGQRHQLWGW